MKRYSLAAVLGFMLVGFGPLACNNVERGVDAAEGVDETSAPTATEIEFMRTAASSNLAEVDMARLAQVKTTNDDVKDYAAMLENDHQDALEDLSAMMQENQVPDVDATDKTHLDSLNAVATPEFDRHYVDLMVEKHTEALAKYRAQLDVTTYSELHDYVENMIPKIENHLAEAQELQRDLLGPAVPANR
jgi:putative membrane protein